MVTPVRKVDYITAGNYVLDNPGSLQPGAKVMTGRATPSSGTIDIVTGFSNILAFVGGYSEAGGTAEVISVFGADVYDSEAAVATDDENRGIVTLTGSDKEINFIIVGLI